MTSKHGLAATVVLALCMVALTPGCGSGSESLAFSSVSITSIVPAALSGTPTPVTINGGDFSQMVGTNVTVRWTATSGAPFAGGSSSVAEIGGVITGPTTITSVSPAAALCGAGIFNVNVAVILPSGAMATTSAAIAVVFAAPAVTVFAGPSNFPAAQPTPFTLNGTNLPVGAIANITWLASAAIFNGGVSSVIATTATVSSATTIDGLSPPALVCGVVSEAATITAIAFSDGSCAPPGLAVACTFDAPTLAILNGAAPPAPVPSTILLGETTAATFVLGGSGFGPVGSLCTVDFGPPLNIPVPGMIFSTGQILGELPVLTTPRLTANTTVDVTVTLPGGSCATLVGLAEFVAPPTITTVVNNRPPFDPMIPGIAIPNTWLHCVATNTTITGTGFDAGVTELFYDTAIGDTAPVSGGALTDDPSPSGLLRTVTVPTTIDGWSPTDLTITDPLATSLRVVNPDLQYHELPGLTWTPTGVLPNVNAGPLAGNNAEMQIVVNPYNGLNAAICAHDAGSGFAQMFHSFTVDGGLTWTPGAVGTPGSLFDDTYGAAAFRFDPMCIFDGFGNYYCVYGVADPVSGNTFVVAIRSTDGGATFLDIQTFSFPVSPLLDRWTVAAGPDALSPVGQALYCACVDFTTGDILTTKMTVAAGAGPNGEGGLWASVPGAAFINDFPTAVGFFYQHGTPSVGPAGETYVSFIEGDGAAPPVVIPTLIWMDVDLAGGGIYGVDNLVAATFSPPSRIAITPMLARGKGVIPQHKVIMTGPHAGRAVIVWSDTNLAAPLLPPDYDTTVVTQYSDDQNVTWSAAQPVHGLATSFQFFPWLGTDPVTGHLYVGYYDTRNDAANNRAVEWLVTGSDDGTTWTPSLLVSQAPSDAGAAGGLNDMLEYNGISVVGDLVYTCWADNSNFTGDNPNGALAPEGFDVLTSVLGLDAD